MIYFDTATQEKHSTKKPKPNYPRKAQAPYNKINKNSVITEFKNSPVIGWVLVALDAQVRFFLQSQEKLIAVLYSMLSLAASNKIIHTAYSR